MFEQQSSNVSERVQNVCRVPIQKQHGNLLWRLYEMNVKILKNLLYEYTILANIKSGYLFNFTLKLAMLQ